MSNHDYVTVKKPAVPQLVNTRTAANQVKGIDGAATGVVRNQQCVAQRPKITRRHSQTPGLVQGGARFRRDAGPALVTRMHVMFFSVVGGTVRAHCNGLREQISAPATAGDRAECANV